MMENMNLNKHISAQFNAELDQVRNQVMQMGGLVEQQLKDALLAIESQDEELADKVMSRDHQINAMEVSVDEECTRIIAKRQPAASDLRLLLAILKTSTDLERIGDGAERIAKVARESLKDQRELVTSLDNLGQHVIHMLHDALDAFARMDVEAAYRVHREDPKVDREFSALLRLLMTYMMEDPRTVPSIISVMNAARTLERIGDRAQNICEYIIYFVKGKDVRHISAEVIKQDVLGQ